MTHFFDKMYDQGNFDFFTLLSRDRDNSIYWGLGEWSQEEIKKHYQKILNSIKMTAILGERGKTGQVFYY